MERTLTNSRVVHHHDRIFQFVVLVVSAVVLVMNKLVQFEFSAINRCSLRFQSYHQLSRIVSTRNISLEYLI